MQDDLLEQQPAEEELAGGDEHLDSGEEAARKLVQEVQINVLGACQRHVRVSIPREEIDRYVEETVGKLALDAVVPGFRPGRAPRKLVERRFRKEVLQQVKSSLLNDSVAQLIDDYDLVPISEPELEEEHVLLPETGPMVYEFHLEVRPEFELPQWKGLELESLDEQVTDQDVEEAVRALLLRYGTLEPTPEPAAKGDHVTVNLTFRHGERLLRELREQELALAPRLLFRDAILEGFDALLAGARPGERRTGTLTLSSDVADPALRGQQVEVELEVLDVKRPQPAPINEALLQRVGGFQDEQELRQAVRRSLTLRYEFEARRHLRNQIRQKLLAQANWDLPPGHHPGPGQRSAVGYPGKHPVGLARALLAGTHRRRGGHQAHGRRYRPGSGSDRRPAAGKPAPGAGQAGEIQPDGRPLQPGHRAACAAKDSGSRHLHQGRTQEGGSLRHGAGRKRVRRSSPRVGAAIRRASPGAGRSQPVRFSHSRPARDISPTPCQRAAAMSPFPPAPQANYREYQRQRQLTLGDLLLENRIILLQGEIHDGNANEVVMKLLYLQSENRRKDIHFYLNSPGGSVTATLAIYDTMQILSCPVATYCVGLCASGAAVLLAGGTKGKRYALPHAKMMIHQPYGQVGGQVSDIEIQAKEILKTREMLNQILAQHTGQPIERIAKDTDRDFYMNAQEAKEYGLVDEILTRPPSPAEEE
jgi:ATP-dependent Clp protease protease subunit